MKMKNIQQTKHPTMLACLFFVLWFNISYAHRQCYCFKCQLQGTGSTPSSSQRQVSDKASINNMVPTRQKSFKHNSSNASTNGGHPQQSAPQVSIAASGSLNSSAKDHTQRSGLVSNDHPHQRNSSRNRNGGSHQRGDGAHHHNYGNRRDQDWNTHRNFNGRDSHMSPRASSRFIRPPPPHNSAQFIHPPPLRPFGGHIGFHGMLYISRLFLSGYVYTLMIVFVFRASTYSGICSSSTSTPRFTERCSFCASNTTSCTFLYRSRPSVAY